MKEKVPHSTAEIVFQFLFNWTLYPSYAELFIILKLDIMH